MKTETKIIADEFGPSYVVEVNSSKPRFKGLLIIDNLALGPGKGGIRMSESLTPFELFRLARTMTWKNSLFDLPFGGAKAGIIMNPKKISLKDKQALMRAFARSLAPFVPKYYIAGPDIGTTESEMKWFAESLDNWKAATGKPANFCRRVGNGKSCGLPHELGSTGFGVARAAKVAADFANLEIKGAKVAVAGFGNVGSFVAKHLSEMGAQIVAVSESEGTVFGRNGLDVGKLCLLKNKRGSFLTYPKAKRMPSEKIYELPVDILIPAAVSDVINENNYGKVKAKIIVEGANIPIPENIEIKLWNKSVVIVPDFVANAGGVISSFVEYQGKAPETMFKIVEKKIEKTVRLVLEKSLAQKRHPRQIALELAKEKVVQAMKSKNK